MTATEPIDLLGQAEARFDEILTPEAVRFVVRLHQEFADRRSDLLAARRSRRAALLAGGALDFLPDIAGIRADRDWRVAPHAPDLTDRRVEITGPTDRKMAVNALNSGARVWLADLEDANSPSWTNMINGQLTLLDAVHRRIDFTSPEGKRYRLGTELPAIMVRPRGWHLPEHHIRVAGRAVAASLVDFGLYFYHCARPQLERGSGPYFYLPKLESHHEARLWNDVFCLAQDELGIPRGTIRATVLIETIPAAFEMEEILYALREHSAGLNAGRWDYIFSIIKNFGARPEFVLPDRGEVTMTSPFMRAYTELLVRTCHRRGAHAIGGMAAFIPSRDPDINRVAFDRVRQDKQREAADGFDGSWVAHPGLVELCREVFDARLGAAPHQLARSRADVAVKAADLLAVRPAGPPRVTPDGLRGNLAVALGYIAAWLGGTGAVALNNLMEDTATAEIARAQVWQWLHTGTRMVDGTPVTRERIQQILEEECDRLWPTSADRPPGNRAAARRRLLGQARSLVAEMVCGTDFTEFLTLPGYQRHLTPASC
jgi:malate synthase